MQHVDGESSALATVSGEVIRLTTSSTRRSTGTGLKKWMPITCSGRAVAMPSFMIGIELVLLASTAVGILDDLVETVEHVDLALLVLDHGLDDELTVGQVADVGGERDARQRLVAFARSSLPADTARSSDLTTRCCPGSAAAASTSATTTSSPARAHTSAMPDPIKPLPTTPTRSICSIPAGW